MFKYIKSFIKSVFEFFGYNIVDTATYKYTEWRANHWETAYNDLFESNQEYHDTVVKDIFEKWENCLKNYKELEQLNKNIHKNNSDLIDLCDKYEKIIEEKDEAYDKLSNTTSEAVNLLNQVSDSPEADNITKQATAVQKFLKERYRHYLADMGTACDRLIGELMSAHNYTEEDIDKCIGTKSDSVDPNVSLYTEIQQFMHDFKWKYDD